MIIFSNFLGTEPSFSTCRSAACLLHVRPVDSQKSVRYERRWCPMDTVTMGVTPAAKSGRGFEWMCQKETQQRPLCQETFSARLCLTVRKSGESKAKTAGLASSLGTGCHHSPVPAVSGVRVGARSPLRSCTDVPSAWISCPSSWAAWLTPGSSSQTQLTLLPTHCMLAAHSLSSLFPQCVTITGLPGGALRARRDLNLSMQAQRPSGSVC